VASSALSSAAQRLQSRGWPARSAVFRHAAGPANLAIATVGLAGGLRAIYLADNVRTFSNKLLSLLMIVAIAWFIYNLIAMVDLLLRRVLRRTEPKLLDTVVALVRKALRIFLLVMVGLFVIQNIFEQNITAWLAGLGIAGLAVSLAAQDPIKNIFGSFTVLAERPFVLGDRIIFNTIDGTVEEIGFRSTRIRTAAGHLVTVPNMRFTDGTIENISRRPSLRRAMTLALTHGTTPEKIEEALRLVRGVLAEPEIAVELNLPAEPPQAYFSEFAESSLNITVVYWYAINQAGRDMISFQKHAERVSLRILRAFGNAGITFAFPTRTVHVVQART
jgi:MscS family membrane protein